MKWESTTVKPHGKMQINSKIQKPEVPFCAGLQSVHFYDNISIQNHFSNSNYSTALHCVCESETDCAFIVYIFFFFSIFFHCSQLSALCVRIVVYQFCFYFLLLHHLRCLYIRKFYWLNRFVSIDMRGARVYCADVIYMWNSCFTHETLVYTSDICRCAIYTYGTRKTRSI